MILRTTLSYLLVTMGSVNAGLAMYLFTGDPIIGVLIFSAAIGLVGSVL